MKKDDFGRRMKEYESQETGKFVSYLPTYMRIDGRSFSKLTKHMERPFDAKFGSCMLEVSKGIMREFHADVVYQQSDEISIWWMNTDTHVSSMLFGGTKQKINSVVPAYASSLLTRLLDKNELIKEHQNPHFDSRVLQFPNVTEAWNMFIWRYMDCKRNAVSSMAQSLFSHKFLHKVNNAEQRELISKELSGVVNSPITDFIEPKYLYGNLLHRVGRDVIVTHPTNPVGFAKDNPDAYKEDGGPLLSIARETTEE